MFRKASKVIDVHQNKDGVYRPGGGIDAELSDYQRRAANLMSIDGGLKSNLGPDTRTQAEQVQSDYFDAMSMSNE